MDKLVKTIISLEKRLLHEDVRSSREELGEYISRGLY